MTITWFGTASIAVETENTKILFDPFVPLNGAEHYIPVSDYQSFDKIFLTHGHIDHLSSIPTIVGNSSAKVYCTKTPKVTLIKKSVPEEKIREIKPGDEFVFNDVTIKVYKGRHITFDTRLILSTVFSSRMIKHIHNLPFIAKESRIYKENNETVCYEIISGGKSVVILGSLSIDEDTIYPKGMDLLILPYQGNSNVLDYALSITNKFEPKRILLDHYDDTFPPISNSIDTTEFVSRMENTVPVTGNIRCWPFSITI